MLLAPALLILLFLYLFSLDKVIMMIVFLTPLAVNYKNYDLGIGISIPTEPLMLGVLFIFLIRLFYDGGYNTKILKHPVTIAILINLLWLFITIFTSEIPLVSVKFFVARLWFLVPFYFIAVIIFRKYKNISTFLWMYVIPLVFVILYTLFNHSQYGFDKPSSNMVMHPFYNDHTAYGAILAIFIPVVFGFFFRENQSKSVRLMSFAVLFILVMGIIFSYSRAAWLSLSLSLLLFIIIRLRIKFRYVFSVLVLLGGLFYLFQFQFIDRLEKNKQDSSTDFLEHIQSISNISSDASNLERINRWNCAIRLFKERPFFGWGPGTYQFVYAPFQRSKEKTIISTNAGDMGNAHSEYIGPLSESGVLGMLTFIAIIIMVMVTGLRVYKRARSPEVKLLILTVLLGLFSYFVHGLLNNFLDSDKASVPFWGLIAVIVALDLYHKNKSSYEIMEGDKQDKK
ncbi:MAG: O-antigen ligase family protein [Bacteroidota bacterium]|nr:O-antigen ligase family protein [Bacteroidota bacterium]